MTVAQPRPLRRAKAISEVIREEALAPARLGRDILEHDLDAPEASIGQRADARGKSPGIRDDLARHLRATGAAFTRPALSTLVASAIGRGTTVLTRSW